MAKQAVNVRLREDQEAAIQAIVEADVNKETDRSKVVRKAVDEFLAKRQTAKVSERAGKYRVKKKK